MRRLILHVGPGRTGTSALQCMFARSVVRMRAQGVHFPTWPGMADAVAGKVTSGNGGPLVALVAPRADARHYTAECGLRSLRRLHDEDAMTVLYSHEALALFDPDRLAFLADMALAAGYVTQAAYYTRNAQDYARSVRAKWASREQTHTPNWSRYTPPFAGHIAALTSVLGSDNVIVRDYDTAKPDLFGDFCANVLGIERPHGQMPHINASLTVTAWHAPVGMVSNGV